MDQLKSPKKSPKENSLDLKIEELKKSPQVFEFDKSGNEQTFYFKEFLPESSKMPEIE